MAKTIRELLVDLGVVADTKKVEQFDASLETVKKTMAAVAAAAVATAAAIYGATTSTAAAGTEAAILAERLRMPAEELQELGILAKRAQVDMGDLEGTLVQLAERASDAARGEGESAEEFARLGIKVRGQNKELLTNTQLLDNLSDALARQTSENEQLAIMSRLFGDAGARLLPILQGGSVELARMRKEARQYGSVLDKDAIAQSLRFSESMADVREIFLGLRNTIGMAFLPVFNGALSAFRAWFLRNKQVINQRLEDALLRIRDGMEAFRDAAVEADKVVRKRFGGWENLFRQVGKALAMAGAAKGLHVLLTLLSGVKALAGVALGAMGAAFSPVALVIGVVVGAFVLLGVAVEDFMVFLRGGKSVFGDFLAQFKRAGPVQEKFLNLFASLRDLGTAVWGALTKVGSAVLEMLPAWDLLTPIMAGLRIVGVGAIIALEATLVLVKAAVDLVTLAFTDFGEATKVVIRTVLDELEPLLKAFERFYARASGVRNAVRTFTGQNLVAKATGGRLGADHAGTVLGAGRTLVNRMRSYAGAGQSLGGASRPVSVTNEGSTFNISGVGMSSAELANIVQGSVNGPDKRKTMNAIQGGER